MTSTAAVATRRIASERQPHSQPRRCGRCSKDRPAVIRIHGCRRGVVLLFESPALIEKDGSLRIQQVEYVQQDVESHTTERDGITEVGIDVIVAGRATFRASRRQEE